MKVNCKKRRPPKSSTFTVVYVKYYENFSLQNPFSPQFTCILLLNEPNPWYYTYVWNWAKIGNDENYLLPNKCFRFLASLMPKIQGLLFDQLKNTVCVKSSKIVKNWKILVWYLLDVFPLYLFVIFHPKT